LAGEASKKPSEAEEQIRKGNLKSVASFLPNEKQGIRTTFKRLGFLF
jgi:hypothetical protein